jgi:quercetin dioxygenase-like cupin family protein
MLEPAGIPRSRAGDVVVSRATGERAIVLRGSEDSTDGSIAFHVFVKAGGGFVREHSHPALTERFRVISGRIGLKLDGEERILDAGADVAVPPGVSHRWWNAGSGEAQVLVEVDQGRRYELLMCTLFGLGNDRLTNMRGMPRLLQRAVIARDYRDVIRFTKPPALVQRLMLGVLAPIGQALGYQPWYPRYLRPHGSGDLDPGVMALLAPRHTAVEQQAAPVAVAVA